MFGGLVAGPTPEGLKLFPEDILLQNTHRACKNGTIVKEEMGGKLKSMRENVLYIVKSFVDGKVEREWDEWHSKQHVPDVLKQPGFLAASKYRDARSNGEYWTLYELESLEAFEKYDKGEGAKRLRADHHARYGGSTRTERFVLVKTFHKGKAASAAE